METSSRQAPNPQSRKGRQADLCAALIAVAFCLNAAALKVSAQSGPPTASPVAQAFQPQATFQQQMDSLREKVRAKGPCVLLKNQSVVYGKAVQLGDSISIRRSNGSRIVLPRKQVLCWGEHIGSLYEFKVDRRQNASPDQLIQDARWCLRNELLTEAANDVNRARAKIGNHPDCVHLMNQITQAVERQLEVNQPTTIQLAAFETESADNYVSGTAATSIAAMSETDTVHDPATLRAFVRHIQPVLLNRCVQCHDRDAENAFRLIAPTAGSRPSQAIAKHNLGEALRYVDHHATENSELIRRVTDDHAGDDAVVNASLSRFVGTLIQWIRLARPSEVVAKSPTGQRRGEGDENDSEPVAVQEIVKGSEKSTVEANSDSGRSKRIARLPTVQNPFDPDLFNRRFHPAE